MIIASVGAKSQTTVNKSFENAANFISLEKTLNKRNCKHEMLA